MHDDPGGVGHGKPQAESNIDENKSPVASDGPHQGNYGPIMSEHDQATSSVSSRQQTLLPLDVHTVQMGEHALYIRSAYIPLRSLTGPVPLSSTNSVARTLSKQEACMQVITLLNTSDEHTLFTHLHTCCSPTIALTASYLPMELAGLLPVLSLFFLLLEVFPDGFYHILSCDAQPPAAASSPLAISHVMVSVYFEGTKMVPGALSELNGGAQRAVDFMVAHPEKSAFDAYTAVQCSSSLVLSVLQRLAPYVGALTGVPAASSSNETLLGAVPITPQPSASSAAVPESSQSRSLHATSLSGEDLLSRELRRCKARWTFVFGVSSGQVSRISIVESENILH